MATVDLVGSLWARQVAVSSDWEPGRDLGSPWI